MTDGGRRLLVVDDERIQRLIVTRAVESVGFTVDGAADLDEAAEWLSRRNFAGRARGGEPAARAARRWLRGSGGRDRAEKFSAFRRLRAGERQ
jgi:CheY-like chemotaxis protein